MELSLCGEHGRGGPAGGKGCRSECTIIPALKEGMIKGRWRVSEKGAEPGTSRQVRVREGMVDAVGQNDGSTTPSLGPGIGG